MTWRIVNEPIKGICKFNHENSIIWSDFKFNIVGRSIDDGHETNEVSPILSIVNLTEGLGHCLFADGALLEIAAHREHTFQVQMVRR